ncbi:hypothetical protein ABFV57_32965, partial [Pseudomonas neuropathica]|uniref:hypothetical protein n=1 Tax=Pseudomonas neuropathica TaxID=2730425 RepID=UPI0034D4AE1D
SSSDQVAATVCGRVERAPQIGASHSSSHQINSVFCFTAKRLTGFNAFFLHIASLASPLL